VLLVFNKNNFMSMLKTYFEVEDLRNLLALKKDYSKFKGTYKNSRGTNRNTGKFWDRKFKAPETYYDLDSMTKEKINYIISLLPKRRSRILDLGIGQGYLEQRLTILGIDHDIYGIDISKTSIERSKRKFKGKFITGDILKINRHYKKGFFDAIVAIEVLEHIPPFNIFGLYKNIYTLLKKRGALIISSPLNEGLKYANVNPSAHLREYSIPILKAEFMLSNFKVEKVKTFYAFKKLYVIKKSFSKILKNHWKPNNVVIKAFKLRRV